MALILNQECDEVAYRCAFACERQGYIFKSKRNTKDLSNKYTKTQIKDFFAKRGKKLDVDYTLEAYKIIEEDKTVVYTLDAMIRRLYKVEIEHKNKWRKVTDVKLWLSPSDHSNFRYGVVNTLGPKGLGYKAGRAEKPYHLPLIREHLINNYGAEEIKGYEADDALGMYQDENTIASHIDKDINMVPGLHLNHVTGESYYIPWEGMGTLSLDNKRKLIGRGVIFFYAQMLTGDAIDNIPGIDRLGGVKAYQLLHMCGSEEEAFHVVSKEYTKFYGKDRAGAVLEEVADLLWVCRREGETGRQYLKNRGFL